MLFRTATLLLLIAVSGCASPEYRLLDQITGLENTDGGFSPEALEIIKADYAALLQIDEETMDQWANARVVDSKEFDIYPILMATSQLAGDPDVRKLAHQSFEKIGHPKLKFVWAREFYKEREASERMMEYMLAQLNLRPKWLLDIWNPEIQTLMINLRQKLNA